MMETIIAMLETMGEDVDYVVFKGTKLDITVNDFEGFDEDWCEIEHEYDAEAVGALIDWLEAHCVAEQKDYYSSYEFEDFTVQLGYASYDI